MADGSKGERDIVIDLTVTGARVIRDATKNEMVKLMGITIAGTSGAAAGSIVLRKESASGSIEFQYTDPTAATLADYSKAFTDPQPIFKGLYMDDQGTAWAAGSVMIVHTA
jgi:hypothetical protein